MNIECVKTDKLTEEMVDRWREILVDSPRYESPFFSPTFAQIIGRYRGDVEVAVLREHDRVIGFFPFQRNKRNHGVPVGWKISDYQGFIVETGHSIDLQEVLDQCCLKSWQFDHLVLEDADVDTASMKECESPFIEFADGVDQYFADKKRIGKWSRIQSFLRKSRKLEREVGPLSLQFHVHDEQILNQLFDWKAAHLKKLGMTNMFERQWALNATRDIASCQEPGFCGTLSALYAGDSLVAAHLGMRNDRVLHWWLTTYNTQFEKYSPGSVFLIELMRACQQEGVSKIDLGKGQERYKLMFANGATRLFEGLVTNSPFYSARFRTSERVRAWVKKSPLQGWARSTKSILKRVHTSLNENSSSQ